MQSKFTKHLQAAEHNPNNPNPNSNPYRNTTEHTWAVGHETPVTRSSITMEPGREPVVRIRVKHNVRKRQRREDVHNLDLDNLEPALKLDLRWLDLESLCGRFGRVEAVHLNTPYSAYVKLDTPGDEGAFTRLKKDLHAKTLQELNRNVVKNGITKAQGKLCVDQVYRDTFLRLRSHDHLGPSNAVLRTDYPVCGLVVLHDFVDIETEEEILRDLRKTSSWESMQEEEAKGSPPPQTNTVTGTVTSGYIDPGICDGRFANDQKKECNEAEQLGESPGRPVGQKKMKMKMEMGMKMDGREGCGLRDISVQGSGENLCGQSVSPGLKRETPGQTQPTRRRVLHYGHKFDYQTRHADCSTKVPWPPWRELNGLGSRVNAAVREALQGRQLEWTADQATVNEYIPGEGIAKHIDTHAAFEDGIASLSLGSMAVIRFATCTAEGKKDERFVDVVVPRRSLFIMTGDSRYMWTHAMVQRTTDKIDGKISYRGTRHSVTYRHVKRPPRCACDANAYIKRTYCS